ncbi:MAG: toll/interleukin-1 receptor domain-containing protein, partial [Clostridia bacterium]
MDERSLICPQCGAQRRVEGSYIVCDSCGSKNVNNILSSEEEVLLIPAKDRLLAGDFDDATIKYSNIIDRFPKCYEAYWGSVLAKYGIQFVDDLREKKKVPTIHNTRIETIKEDSLYLNAIKYAPKETRENYEKYADMIETIRLEWIEKASKEKPYDVFICFKDSDLEHGIERTEDSVSASELYTFLSREGYNVFFSRESLRDKISEQYEPYIFNALNTAKAMIVYGSKAEYIESTWVKNEWRRYICKIRNGEKYANSLIIAYEKMPISSLPREFQSLQCLDASKKTYYPDLLAHLKKVMENAKKPVSAIEHREIKTGQVGKKAASVVNAVKKIDLGGINVKQVSASENTGLNTAMVFLDKGMFPNAITRLSAVLEINPTNAKAIWFSMLARLECKNNDEFVAKSIKLESFRDVKDAIENADKDEASVYIDVMCEAVKNLIAQNQIDKAINFFEFVMNYQSESGDALREFILEQSLEKIVNDNETASSSYFEAYLKYTENIDTDRYINLCAERLDAAAKFNLVGYMQKMAKRIIAVDEGNVYALWWDICLALKSKAASQIDNICEFNDYTAFEKMLGYCKTTSESDGYVVKFISSLSDSLTEENCEKSVKVFDSLISYVKGDSQVLKCLHDFAQSLLKLGQFELAEKYYAIVVTRDNSDFLGYWGLLKAKLKCKDEDELTANDVLIDTTDEFNSAINAASAKDTKLSNEFINKCIELSKDQPKKIALKKKKEIEDERIEKENKAEETKQKKKARAKKIGKILVKTLTVLFGIFLMAILTFYFSTTSGQYAAIIVLGLIFLGIVAILYFSGTYEPKTKRAIFATILVVSMIGTHFGLSALMKKDSNGNID